jgi:hypothetical protein
MINNLERYKPDAKFDKYRGRMLAGAISKFILGDMKG